MKIDISKMINATKFTLKKHAPEILVFLGIGGMTAGGVLACHASRKLDTVLEDHRERLSEAGKDEDNTKELMMAYLHTGVDMAKLYGPSVIVAGLSAGSILVGNNMFRKRNMALAAAYVAVDQGFKDYRNRVVERFGEETDTELRLGLHKEKITEEETDEKGKKKKVKREIAVAEDTPYTDYARYFVKGEAKAAEYSDTYNSMFLRAQQELANHMLRAKGYLFLNEVYEMLGIEPSVAGQTVGWVYDKNDEEHGDNYVNFRIQEVFRKNSDEDGDYKMVFMIDPNVDGPVLERALKKGLLTK